MDPKSEFNLNNKWIYNSIRQPTDIPDFLEFYDKHRNNFYTYKNIICNKNGVFYSDNEARRARLINEHIPTFKSKKQRDYDIRWLFQNHKQFKIPIEKKRNIAKKYKISISQLYRTIKKSNIVSKDYIDNLFKEDFANKKLKKKNSKLQPIPEHITAIISKYKGVHIIRSGKREILNKSKYLQLEHHRESFKIAMNSHNKAIIFNNSILPITKFSIELKKHIHSESIDESLAKRLKIPPYVIRGIRCYNLIKLPQYSSKSAEQDDIELMVKYVFTFRIFRRKVKRIYQEIHIPEHLTNDTIAELLSMPAYKFYRQMSGMNRFKKDVENNPPRTYMLMKFDQKWFDIDTFTHADNPPFININF